jgi:integrase
MHRGIRLLRLRRTLPPRREIVVPEEDYKKILKVSDQAFRDLITVAWECGPRSQELLPLEIRNRDLSLLAMDRVSPKYG